MNTVDSDLNATRAFRVDSCDLHSNLAEILIAKETCLLTEG